MLELTKSELSVLQVLWKDTPLSVREVHDRMSNGWAYNTTKTVMDRMTQKGLLERTQVHGVFVYHTQVTRAQGLASWVRFFADRVLELDDRAVVNLFADSELYSEEELQELQHLLDNHQPESD